MTRKWQFTSTRNAYGKKLLELGRKHKEIVVLDADSKTSTQSILFEKEFPDRFFNLGIQEANMISMAAGFASTGLVPFVSAFSVFITGMVYNQIRQSIAYSKLNVKLTGTHAGLTVGEDGATHQMVEDISLMNALPNMVVVAPADTIELEKTMDALMEWHGPSYTRLYRVETPVVTKESDEFELGKGYILEDGTDITIIAYGIMVSRALEARDILNNKGIFARVVNMPTIKPLDRKLILKCASETKGIVVAEEHSVLCGLGTLISSVVCEHKPVPVLKVGVLDIFGMSGKGYEILDIYGLTSERIANAAEKLMTFK